MAKMQFLAIPSLFLFNPSHLRDSPWGGVRVRVPPMPLLLFPAIISHPLRLEKIEEEIDRGLFLRNA